MLTLARDALIYLACILGLVLLLSGVATKVRALECPTMVDMMTLLAEDYGERPLASAVMGQTRSPVMFFLNVATGTWTAVMMQDGCARAVAAGDTWVEAPASEPVIPGEDT